MTDGCFRQVEFAGVLAGTKHAAGGPRRRRLLAVASAFQADDAAVHVRVPGRSRSTAAARRCSPSGPCRPAEPADRAARRHRGEPRAVGRRSGRRWCCTDRVGPHRRRAGAPDRARPRPPRAARRRRGCWRWCPTAFLARVLRAGRWSPILGRGLVGRRARRCSPDPYTWQVVAVHARRRRVLSTVLTLALALPGAYVSSRLRVPRAARCWSRSMTVPFVLPTVVVGLAFRAVLPAAWVGTLGAILRRPRVLQLRRRGARRRRAVGAARPALRRRPRAPWAPRRGARSARSPGRCCGRRWSPPPSWSSCSRSPRSASCSCSADPARRTLEVEVYRRTAAAARPAGRRRPRGPADGAARRRAAGRGAACRRGRGRAARCARRRRGRSSRCARPVSACCSPAVLVGRAGAARRADGRAGRCGRCASATAGG